MIEAEYEELEPDEGALGLADTDSLPWLESGAEDEEPGGLDPGQVMLFLAALVLLLGAAVGAVWYFTSRAEGGQGVPEGGVIAAPEGPVKERPEDPGGKQFAGTGNVAPVVSEGGSRPAVVAAPPAAASATSAPAAAPAPAASAAAGAAAPATTAAGDAGGVAVQLAAEQGWGDLARRTDALAGVRHRVVEAKVDRGTVYRLQALAPNRAEAEKLCSALKADGLACQIKSPSPSAPAVTLSPLVLACRACRRRASLRTSWHDSGDLRPVRPRSDG